MEKELMDVLSGIEPFVYTINGMPVKRISYSQNQILIEAFTQRELDMLRTDWWEDNE